MARTIKASRRKRILIVICFAVICILVCTAVYRSWAKKDKRTLNETELPETLWSESLFVWHSEHLLPEHEDEIAAATAYLGCSTIYQHISASEDEAVILSWMKRRSQAGHTIFYLAGTPEWATAQDAASMKETVRRAARLNRQAGKDSGFSGIVFDIEPYLLDGWDSVKEQYMEAMVEQYRKIYPMAKKENLLILACIPNFYDSKGLTPYLEELIKNGCDGIAVMNYRKDDEVQHLETEAALAAEYDKAIINITEMQKPGHHDLTENNTYYNDGIQAVKESWSRMEEEINYDKLGFSWHSIDPVLELMESEGKL